MNNFKKLSKFMVGASPMQEQLDTAKKIDEDVSAGKDIRILHKALRKFNDKYMKKLNNPTLKKQWMDLESTIFHILTQSHKGLQG